MAHDRNDTRDAPRDERARWRSEQGRERGGREDRGFFERAGDEVASWFGDEEAERRRRDDERMRERELERDYNRYYGREGGGRPHEERSRLFGRERDFGRGRSDRDEFRSTSWTGREPERGYRPVTGDYGRASEQFFAAGGIGREEPGRERGWREPYAREERTSSFGPADRSREYDPHYHSWRQRHMSDLDRDYEEYRRENQARFEREFGSWRERRMHKRALLDQMREHMEVVGSDDQHVGTFDRTAGDRLILTKSDPESGGVHHSLSCADVDRIEGDRVILDLKAEDAKQRWRDESRERALSEREDQGEMGPRSLGRSFEGTYR